jgi:DNA primase
VRKALATAGPPPDREGADPRHARVRSKPAGSLERAEIVGALMEWPELLEEREVEPHLELLEGPSAQTVAALRRSLRQNPKVSTASNLTTPSTAGTIEPPVQKTLDATVFLAQIPPAIQAFASERLAAPKHDSLADARGCLIENAMRLRKLVLEREVEEIAREQHKTAGIATDEMDLLREALAKRRQQQGVK